MSSNSKLLKTSISSPIHPNKTYFTHTYLKHDIKRKTLPWLRRTPICCRLVLLRVEVADNSTYCAYSQGVQAMPASATHFCHHPRLMCHMNHPAWVIWVESCSIHRGLWNKTLNQCDSCYEEQCTGLEKIVTPLRNTVGYPGDDQVQPTT